MLLDEADAATPVWTDVVVVAGRPFDPLDTELVGGLLPRLAIPPLSFPDDAGAVVVVAAGPLGPDPAAAPVDPVPDPEPEVETGVTPGHAWAKAVAGVTMGGAAAGLAGPGFW